MKKKPTSQLHLSNRRTFVGLAALLAFTIYPAAAHAQAPSAAGAKLNATEAKTMADGLKPMLKLNDSDKGLTPVTHADGTISTDLQGRFQNVTVAVKGANGAVTQGCINNTEAAAGFFGIDRKLLDLAPKAQPTQPADR